MSQFDLNLAVQQYTNTVQLLVQQKGSRLRDTVMVQQHYGKQAVAVDQYAPVNATKVQGRAAPIVWTDTANDRRWVSPADYRWVDGVDNFDKLRLLNDPMSSYVQSGAFAMLRAMDDEIINGFFGVAKTGETGSNSTNFLSANQISVSFGASAATGLNVAKLIEARRILMANEVDLEMDPLYCIISAKQHANLLNEIQVVNSDYAATKRLENGQLTSFLGINFIHSERLPINGSSYRRVPVYTKSGMHLGLWNDVTTSIDKRVDLESLPWQVYVYGTFGATRTEEKRIVEIPCSES